MMQPLRSQSVLGRTYEGQNCSAARALEVVGERWSLLIIRDIGLAGITRFTDLQRRLGVARNILAARLDHLTSEGVVERDTSATYPAYTLTPKGEGLLEIVVAMAQWGDQWYAPAGPPATFHHDACDGEAHHQLTCATCGRAVSGSMIVAREGPGFRGRLRQGRARRARGDAASTRRTSG
jgi:DNA-binding HxlR family transcriptional regulator